MLDPPILVLDPPAFDMLDPPILLLDPA
jgi:hypothetical protein